MEGHSRNMLRYPSLHFIKKLLKQLAMANPRWSLFFPVRSDGVRVLMYHRICSNRRFFLGVDPRRFREEMRWLARYCRLISVDELPDAAKTPSRHRRSVLVTFDDGFRDYHDHAYPILEELRIPAVVFVATAFLDHGGAIWTDAVQFALATTRERRIAPPWNRAIVHELDSPEARERAAQACKTFLKGIPDVERRSAVSALLGELGVDQAAIEATYGRQMLTWDEVRATREFTTYGGHSHTHPILSQLDDDGIEYEIATCQRRLTEELGAPARHFAYPNGRSVDFDARVQAALRRHGFEAAFSTNDGRVTADVDWMAIPRKAAGGSTLADFAFSVGFQ